MAQQNNMLGDILGLGLLAGGAYLAWTVYQSYLVTAAAAATTPVSTTTTTPATTTTSTTTTSASATGSGQPAATLVIPTNLTVTPDINNSLKGTVNVNGQSVPLNVIPSAAGQASGVVYNSSGQDVTAMFTAGQITQLITAFSLAPQSASGVSGFGRGFGAPMAPNYLRAGTPMFMPGPYGQAARRQVRMLR
jgi:hypothetical protein